MTQKNLAWAAAAVLIYQAAVKMNEPSARTLDFNGLMGFWLPAIVGGLLLWKLAS